MAKSPSQVKQLKKISNNKKPKVESNKQKLGKRQGYLYNVGKSITYVAMEKIKTMNPVISDFSDNNNDLFKNIYRSAIDYRTTYKRGLDAIMKSKFYEAANIGLTALKEDIATGNLYNKERVEKLEMREMGLGDLDSGGFDDSFSADLGDLNLDDWGDDFTDFDDNSWDEEDSTSSDSFSDQKTAAETLATINSIEGSSQANANAISMAVARSAEYSSNVNIKNTNLLYTQNTRAFGLMNGHLDAMNSNMGSVLQYLDKNMTPHLSNSTEFFTDTSKALQDQVSLLREIAENTRKIEATTNSDGEGKKNKIGYSDVVDGGGIPDLVEYGKRIMKNSNSYLNELTGGSWNMMMQGTGGENSNMLALFAANPYGALLSSMINRMTPKDLEKAFDNMNKTIGGFFASMITKLNTMSNSEDSMIDKFFGKVFGIRNSAKSSIDVSQYEKGKVDWNGKSQKALTEVIPQQLSKILSALTGKQETTFNYETGKFVTYDDMKKEFDNMKNSFWKNAASEPMQEIRSIANKNLAFDSKEDYDKFFKDLERLFEVTYSKGETIDFQRNDFREKYIDYGVDEKNLLTIQSILRELPRNIMMQYNADMQEQYTNQTKKFTELEKSGQYAYLFNNSNHNEFAKEIKGEKNKKVEKTKFNTNLLLDTKDNFGRNIFFYMQNIYKELNYMRILTTQGFGGGGGNQIPGMPLDLIQNYQIVDSNGNVYYKNYDRSFKNISKDAIKDDRSESEKMSDSAKKALERDRENKSFLRQQEKRLEKGEILVNISNTDVDNVRGAVRTNVQTNKNKQMLNEEKEKEKTDFEKLKEEMGISGKSYSAKFDKFAEKAQKYIKRPSSVMTDMVVKIDQGLFELIYGKEGQDGRRSVKGILDHLIFEMKKSFSRFNEFLDEKILDPLKDRLGLDKDTGLIKGIYKKVVEYFGLNEKKDGVKNFFKQVGNTMKESIKGIGSSIFGSIKDVFSPLTDKFKSKNFFDKKKNENKEEDEDLESNITNEVTKILRNYNFDNYDNLSNKEKYNLTRQGIEHAKKVKSGKSNNMNEIYDMNNIKLELKELEEQTKNLKDIKDYSNLPGTIKALEKQLPLVIDHLNELKVEYAKIPKDQKDSKKAKKFKEEIKRRLKRIDIIKDTIEKSKKRLEEINNNNKNIEEDIKTYNQAKQDIIDKNNFKKYDIDQKQKVLNEQAYAYFQSDEYKNLSVEEKRRVAEEMLSGDTKNIIDQLKKSQDRLKELKNQDGTEIGRYKNYKGVKTEKTKYGRKNAIRKIDTGILQDIEKKKIKDLTNQFNETIKVNDMSLPALRYLASLDDKYQGLLSEITTNGESEELNKEMEKIEKTIQEVEGDLNSNNIRTLAGLNLEFDKSAKQKLIDSFKGTFGEDNIDIQNVLSKTIDKLFEGRDSNYKENFENVTVAEILSQRDNVLKDLNDRKEKNIQSRNKITKKKMKSNPEYEMSKNAPVNKRIASLEKEIEQVEVIFDEFTKSITESLGITEDGKTSIYDHRTEDIEIIDAFERIKKQNEANKPKENQQDKDRPWSENLSSQEGSSFITDRKFITESMKEQTTTAESMDNTLKNILNILQVLSGYDRNQNVFSLAKDNMFPVVNPLRNITAENEQVVLRNFINGLTTDITRTTESYFGRVGIPGFAKGGVINKDQLAVVGKGETIIPALEYDKRNQIVQQIRESIGKIQSGKWKDNKIHDQAKHLYQNIASIMGAENIDPNILISLISKSGDAGNDFANMENQEQQKHFVKVAKLTQQALSQRNEGVINNSGAQTEKGEKGEYTQIFSETFKIYENAISKIMKTIVGDDDEKEEKEASAGVIKKVMSEAKLYAPDVVSGALLGAGTSLLTGFVGGPLLGAAVGSGLALIKNSTKVQEMLFGKKEFDKDGNYIGRENSGLLPNDLVNKAAKVFPDMKKYGIVGALSGFTFLNPLGPIPGLLIGSALGMAKNNATIQSRLFGETGIIGEDRWNKFKKNLPNMLAGAGVGFGLNMLNLSGPFGVLGSILIGSALGYASTTDKFKEIIFGTFNPKTGKQEGGIVGFFKEKIAEPFIKWAKRDILKPLKDAFNSIPRQIAIMFKTVFGGLAKKVIGFFTKTLVVPIREKIGGFLNTVFSPFKNLGKRLIGTVGRIISTPARILGGVGRATTRHQIKSGTADNMTAEERLNYMNDQNEMNFFYKQSQKIKNEAYDNVSEEMEKRFGTKQAKIIKALMKTGQHEQAQKYIRKQFGDVKDEDSKIVMENMLKNVDNYKKYFGSRILRDTYYERKEAADDVKNQVETQYQEFIKANPKSKISREDYIKNIYGEVYENKVINKGYNNDEADKLLASMTNEELSKLVDEYKAFGVSDEEYDNNKKKAGKEITKLLKNMNIGADGKLSRKDRSEILFGLNYGKSDLAIKHLRKLAEEQGIKLEDNEEYNKIIDIMKEYQITEKLRLDKEMGKSEYNRKVNELVGNSTFLGNEMTFDTFAKLAMSENKLRDIKGKIVDDKKLRDKETDKKITDIISGITNLNKDLTAKQEETNTLLKDIRDFKTGDKSFQEARKQKKIRLDNVVFRDEQNLSTEQKRRLVLLRRLNIKSLEEQPDFIRKMSLKELTTYVKKFRTVSNKELMKQYKEEAEAKKKAEEEAKKKAEEEAEAKKQEEQEAKKQEEENKDNKNDAIEKIKENSDKKKKKEGLTKEQKKSLLDDEGNEVVMKQDSKTGQFEADTTDSSTRKSIKIGQRLREKQESFYDTFSNLFKKNEKEEQEEKKSGGWLSKVLMALGLGKSLLGKAKGLLGGILGRGAIGSLFTRGIFGSLGKGALVIGGLMYLPEIIDLFKTKIGPAISESWDNTIKPWLAEEALPRLKDGLIALVKEIPSLLAGTIKFIGSELIPLLLKGIGWDIGDKDNITYDENGNPVSGNGTTTTGAVIANTAIRSSIRKGTKYSNAVKKSVSKNVAEEGATKTFAKSLNKTGVKEIAGIATKSGTKSGIKGIAKTGLKTIKDFALHPVKTSIKGAVKGTKAMTNVSGKVLGNVFLKSDAKRMVKNGSTFTKKAEGKILNNVVDNTLSGRLINFCKEQFTKLFTNKTVVSLLGSVKKVPIAKTLLEKFVPKILEVASKNIGKLAGTALARAVGSISTGGIVTAGFAIYDFVSGFKDARNILGITESEVPFGYRIAAAIVKTVQGLSIIATLIPTKTIMSVLISILQSAGVDMGNIKEQQEKAEKEVQAYNEQNGTNYSLEEYNKEVKGYKGIFATIGGGIKSVGSKAFDGIKSVGGKIGKFGKTAIGAGKWAMDKYMSFNFDIYKSIFGWLIDGFGKAKDELSKWYNNDVKPIFKSIGDTFINIKDWAKRFIQDPIKTLGEGFQNLLDWFKDKFSWVFDAGSFISNKWDNVKESAGNAWSSVKNGVKNIFTQKPSENINSNVSNIKTVNGMSVGQGEDDVDIKSDIEKSELNSNIQEATSDYAKDRIKNTTTKYVVKGISSINKSNILNQSNDAGTIQKILNKIKSGIQYILNTKTVVNILGQTKNGESVAKILYDNFVPQFIKLASERLQKSMPEAIARLSSQILSGGMTSFAFAVTDFITGFENAESILGIIEDATFIEKIIAAMLEALKGFSIFSIVPSDLIITLLFDVLEIAGVSTGNIGQKRANAKSVVSNYNRKNNTSHNIASYNSEVLGRKGFFSSIASSVSSGLSKVSSLFGKGEGDIVNGNPYFSQKQAKGQLSQMISDAGCGPTSTAMALSKVTGRTISPESIASNAYKNKTWDSEGARGSMFASEAKKYGVKTISSGGDFAKFDKMVSAGIPTAVSGTLGKGEDSPYTKAGHIVTVFGKDKNGNYLVNDPRGKKYSKAYSKEELMNGFRDSWSFGKGDDDSIPSTKSVMNNVKISAKSLSSNELSGVFRKKSTSTLNYISKSIKGTGLIESAGKVLEEIFTKIFNDDSIINLLGDSSDSNYSASSVLLANFVPQVIKRLKLNCEKNKSLNMNKYLRAIISNSNIGNISFLISNFISAFNNPSKYIGKYETYTTGMKTCAAIMSIINERFVIDKILSSSDWATLLEKYVMPVFGESKQDVETIKRQAEKIVKEFDLNSMSTNAQTNTLNSIAQLTGSESKQSIFSKFTGGLKNIAGNVTSGIKSIVNKAGNAANSLFNGVKNAASATVGFLSGLFGKGEYVGRGKEISSNSQEEDSILGLNNFPYFSQHKSYVNYDKPNLSKSGCGPTSAAMVLSKVTGKTILPDEVAKDGYNVGLYDNNGTIDSMFPYLGKKYGVNVKSLDNFNQIKQYANRGVPMIISGEGGNLYGKQSDGHIVAMFGKTKNGYIVNDPSSVKGSKTYNETQLKEGFRHAWVFGDTGYREDIKDAEQVMGLSNKNNSISYDSNFVGKGSDPTTLTYVNGFPYWSQVAFGGSIMNAGCGPTAAAMAFGQVTGKTLNPKDMCNDGKSYGWSPSSGVTNSSKLFNHYAKKYNVDIELINSLSKTKELAAKGYPLIVDGQKSKSSEWAKNCMLTPYGPNGHYQALFGKVEDGYVMNDPRGSKYSGARSEAQLSDGFKFAYKIGNKTYKVDPSKVKKIGDSSGAESSGSSIDTNNESTESNTSSSSASDFFSDMATTALNFSKRLFGFEVNGINTPSNTSYRYSDSSEDVEYVGTDYKAGQSVKASFTAYYPNNSSMEGGYYDCNNRLLKPENQTCAAPKEVPIGTKIKISNTNTSLDGKVYTVTDRGGSIRISNGVYRIDILVSEKEYKNFKNCKGNITFMGIDGKSNTGKGEQYYGKGEKVDWGYFCDPNKGVITSYFGEKRSKYGNSQGNHGALDYNIKYQPLYAPKSGKVVAEDGHWSYGNALVIKTNNDDETYYRLAHMSSKAVKKGDTIKQGQYLGKSGNSGHSLGAHVHLEVLKGGTSKSTNGRDPLNYYGTKKGNKGTIIKLKDSDLTFKEYMDNIGNISEVNDGETTTNNTATSNTESNTSSSSASDFFSDMATAVLNFSKKLFGFDLEEVNTGNETTDTSSSGSYSNVSGGSVAEKIVNFGKSKGASAAANAGLLGNAWCETGFNPAEKGNRYFGLFQWIDEYGQWDALNKVAKEMGVDWTDTGAQLNYMWEQLHDSTHKVWLKGQYGDAGLNGFLNETDPYQAGYKFNKFFERGEGGQTRGRTAATIYNKYMKNGNLYNFDQFLKTGKGEDVVYGKGDDKVTLSSKLIEYALSFLNKGFYYSQSKRDFINNNKNASDCSSFTHHVFDRAANTEIGNYTEEQYLSKNGTKVKRDDLLPGDILLFKNTASNISGKTKYKDNVSHSSIYLGDDKYIESTESKTTGFSGIRIGSLNTNWSKNHWLTGKRFIQGDKKVNPVVKNPNEITKFNKATGSYTLPDIGGTSSSGSPSSSSSDTSSSDFFNDMATAALNFSKKLFGFDIEDNTTSQTTTESNSSDSNLSSDNDYSSIQSKVSVDDFNKSVFLGDSIAVALKNLGGLPSNRVIATGGDTVKKGLDNGNVGKAIAKKPAVLITHYGTNDAGWIEGPGSTLTSQWYKDNYKKLINKVKKESPKTKIVLTQTFTPPTGVYKEYVKTVQKALPSIASENSVNLVDSRSIDKASYRAEGDPIHPQSAEFYKNWINDIKKKITTAGKGEDNLDNTSEITKDIDKYFEDTLDGIKSSDFGLRDNEFHTGVDYAARENTPIKSPISGKVVENINDNKFGFGNTIVVRDKKGVDHRFAHMRDQSSYGLGTKIRKGDEIGNVGSTGRSTGSHLHYEISDKGKSLNPTKYFDKSAHGGTNNSLDKVTLSFPESNQKIDANISSNNSNTINEKMLKQLITIIISILNKVANNTESVKEIVELLLDIKKSMLNNNSSNKIQQTSNKSKSSDTDKTKTQKIFSLLQKGVNNNDNDTSNTQAILDILEVLAKE